MGIHEHRWSTSIIAFFIVGNFSFGTAQGKGGDTPLKHSEKIAASSLALNSLMLSQTLNANSRASVVRMQSARRGNAKLRKLKQAVVLVQVYDYDSDRLITTTVNLNDRKVSRPVIKTGRQPPLASEERQQSISIALGNKRTMKLLAEVFQNITGESLTDPLKQLSWQSRNFRVKNPDNRALSNAEKECQRQRCAELAVVTRDSVLINIVPVINLSTRSVSTIIRTGPPEDIARDMTENARQRRATRATRRATASDGHSEDD